MISCRAGSNPVVSTSTNAISSSNPNTASRARSAYDAYAATTSGSVPGWTSSRSASVLMGEAYHAALTERGGAGAPPRIAPSVVAGLVHAGQGPRLEQPGVAFLHERPQVLEAAARHGRCGEDLRLAVLLADVVDLVRRDAVALQLLGERSLVLRGLLVSRQELVRRGEVALHDRVEVRLHVVLGSLARRHLRGGLRVERHVLRGAPRHAARAS
ncbi:hypothetical protein emb_1d0684 [Coriobacteriaceae bacterium EMTCatB1]|nr:hypothetical protein emb_1d0684 [Coriobacteriaceae bacterium EMTCatB1]